MEPDISHVVAAIKVAFGILAARFLAALSLLMTCALFGWAMASATWLHFIVAATFGMVIFLPVLWSTRTIGANSDGQSKE